MRLRQAAPTVTTIKMGITARGAWESVKRHFKNLDVDTQRDLFSVVGIGDMAGMCSVMACCSPTRFSW